MDSWILFAEINQFKGEKNAYIYIYIYIYSKTGVILLFFCEKNE